MGVLGRCWTLHGSTLVGTHPDLPDLNLVAVRPHTTAELDDVTDTLNQLSQVQRGVYRTQRAYERKHMVPASARWIGRRLGISAMSVTCAFDALEAKGLGSRPAKGSGNRPFHTYPPLLIPEGAKR